MAFAAAVGVLLFTMRDALFLGRTSMTHDTVNWIYPIFTYLADGVLHGSLPLWNPFSRGGEPLLPSYLQTRLFDPIDYATIYVGSLFTEDLTTLFNWDRTARMLAAAVGTHLLIRRWARHLVTRILLAFIVVLSSMTLNMFHQCGINDQYYCAPFIALFLFRILEGNGGWAAWCAMLFFLGSSMQSYFFVGSLTLVLAVIGGYALTRREQLAIVLRDRATWFKLSASALFLLVMTGPTLMLIEQQKDFQMSARMAPALVPEKGNQPIGSGGDVATPSASSLRIVMPYRYIQVTGTPSRPADLLGLLAPGANDTKNPNGTNPVTRIVNGATWSDSRLFIGGLVFAISLMGMAWGRSPFRGIWLLILGVFGALMLGAYTPVHQALYWLYPPLWVIRHTQQLVNFFLLALLFFFALGCDRLLAARRPSAMRDSCDRRFWWRPSWDVGSVFDRLGGHGSFTYLPSAVTIGTLVFFARNITSWSFEATSSALVAALVVLLTMYTAIATFAQFAAESDQRYLSRGARKSAPPFHGSGGTLAICIVLASAGAIAAYQFADGTHKAVTTAASHVTGLCAAIATIYVLLLLFDRLFADRQAVPAVPGDRRRGWWLTTNRRWYWRARSWVESNTWTVLGLVVVAALIAIFDPFDLSVLPALLASDFVTMYGRNFERCGMVLGLIAFVQLTLAVPIRASLVRAKEVVRKSIAWAATLIALHVFVTLPNPHSGYGSEILMTHGAPTPADHDFFLLVSCLVLANFVLAGLSLRRCFVVYLLVPMTLVGSLVVAAPLILWVHVSLFILLPLVCLHLLRRYRIRARRTLIAAILLGITAVELGLLSIEFKPEIGVDRHALQKNWAVVAGSPAFPATRVAAIEAPPYSVDTRRPLRFSELLAREGTAHGTPRSYPDAPFVADTPHLLGQPRWNTFFTLKTYDELANAGLTPDIFDALFGVGRPLVQFKPHFRTTENFASDIEQVPPSSRLSTLADTVFLDTRTLPSAWRPPEVGPGRSDDFASITDPELEYDKVSFTVESGHAGFVYLADAYTPDWIATVNGRPVHVFRANGHFKAVAVPAGKSAVTIEYRPERLIWTLRLFFWALASAALVALFGGIRALQRQRRASR